MHNNRSFHFVAVNYNNSKLTFSYIESIISLGFKNYNIFIVDNDSNEKDICELEEFCNKYPHTFLIKNNENIGYFSALNVGLKQIKRGSDDYVIIGNNDLTFQADFIEKIDSILITDDVLVISPNIITQDNIHQNPHIVNKFNLVQRIYRKIYYSNYYVSIILQFFYSILKFLKGGSNRKLNDKIIPIWAGYGACYILTPSFFKHFERLDAPVFLMGEELIIAAQVLRVEGIILYHPDLVVNHLDHASIGKIESKFLYGLSQTSYRYYIKNEGIIQK